ncbi:MAG: DUF3488 domain-containing protein [Planctomycetes bacterium]|nr:DUF3488 domain-containing protein [Planctomycetota bacterium]
MKRVAGLLRVVASAEVQGFAAGAGATLAGYLCLALAERNRPLLALLAASAAWRLLHACLGSELGLLHWTRPLHRGAGAAFLLAGWAASGALASSSLSFLGSAVVWLQALLLVTRGRTGPTLRALAFFSLVHAVLAAFVPRPAPVLPLLLAHVFLVVRTFGVASRSAGYAPERWRFLTLDAGTFAAVACPALVLFLVLPRPTPPGPAARDAKSANRPAGLPGAATAPEAFGDRGDGKGELGFSPEMTLGDLTELLKDQRLAMRARVLRLDAPPTSLPRRPELYLRGVWFDDYVGGRWARSGLATATKDAGPADAREGGFVPVPSGGSPSSRPAGAGAWELELTMGRAVASAAFAPPGVRSMEWPPRAADPRYRGPLFAAPAAGPGADARVPPRLLLDAEEGCFFPGPPLVELAYRTRADLVSSLSANSGRIRRRPEEGAWVAVHAAQERYRELAERAAAGWKDEVAKVTAIRDHLLTGYEYSLKLDPPPPDQDPVEHFLWGSRTGYCVHYATAMALLLRSIGIPCRVAGGYYSTEWDAARKEFLVRQAHAHAWVEVPFDGLGWVPFDPTPPQHVPEEGTALGAGAVGEAGGATGPSSWGELWLDLERFDRRRWLDETAEHLAEWTAASLGGRGARAAVLFWLGVAGAVLLVLGELVRRRGAARGARGRGRPGAPARPAPAPDFYRTFVRLAERRGLRRAAAETPAEFARRVDLAAGDGRAAEVVRAYYEVAFGGRRLDPEAAARVKAALAGLDSGFAGSARRPARPTI